jgi:glycosyltransferase involved in cell wall biosynthesis
VNRSARYVVAHGLFSYQIGGSERIGADLAIEFKARGHEVVCFAFYDTAGPIRNELESHGITCVDLNYESRRGRLRRFTYQVEFYRFLKKWRVDYLVVHHATALMLCGIPARLAGVRSVAMIEHAIHQLRDRPDYRRSATRYCRFADVITGVDPGIVDYFRTEMNVPAARLRYIPNGVRLRERDEARRAAVRSALGIRADEFVFLFAGRLQPVKDVPTLLSAAAALPESLRARTRVLLAGDGPERSKLEAQATSLGLNDVVRFLGARRDVPDLLAAADAFVMTSVTEGQPMALIEAMAAGVPCVATRVGGIPVLLGDGAGLLAPPSAPEQIAAEMARMISSEEVRSQCVQAGLRVVRAKHSLDQVVDEYFRALGMTLA